MKGSCIVIACFVVGFLAGHISKVEVAWLHTASVWLLYLLMFQVGLSVGSDPRSIALIKQVKPATLLLPLTTVAGAIALTASVSPLFKGITCADAMAVNSVCGYYSLSSIMLPNLRETEIGAVAAAQLGAIALLANVVRELMALTGAPLIARYCGKNAVVAAAGVTSVDVCLPAIRRWCGENYVGIAIVHGTLIDITCPFLLSFFASL